MRDFGVRAQLLAALDRILSYSATYHRDQAIGQMNMFGDDATMSEDLLSNLAYLPEENRAQAAGLGEGTAGSLRDRASGGPLPGSFASDQYAQHPRVERKRLRDA